MDQLLFWTIIDEVVVCGSFLVFFFIFNVTLFLLIKATQLPDNIENAADQENEKLINGDAVEVGKGRRHQFPNKEDYYLKVSHLPNQLIVSAAGIVVVMTALAMTDVLGHPFAGSGHSLLTHYTFLVIIGHQSYCLFAKLLFGFSRDKVTSLVSHSLAIVTYAAATYTKENTMLALTGIVYHIPFVLFAYEGLCTSQPLKMFLQKLSIILVVVFLLILPTLSVGYSLAKESIFESLSLWSTSTFFLSVIYFGLLTLWILLVKVRHCQQHSTEDANPNEKTKLLKY